MNNLILYLWLVILIVYIISPIDLHPLFLDDLIVLGVLAYLYFKKIKPVRKRNYSYYRTDSNSRSRSYRQNGVKTDISLDEAYRILEISPDASWEDVKKAYREKIAMCHPDKVSHLSKELQEKTREMTLKLNNVIEVIKNKRTDRV